MCDVDCPCHFVAAVLKKRLGATLYHHFTFNLNWVLSFDFNRIFQFEWWFYRYVLIKLKFPHYLFSSFPSISLLMHFPSFHLNLINFVVLWHKQFQLHSSRIQSLNGFQVKDNIVIHTNWNAYIEFEFVNVRSLSLKTATCFISKCHLRKRNGHIE